MYLRHNFNPCYKELCCCILKLLCVHITPGAPSLCSCDGLSELIRRYLGTGLQVTYSFHVDLRGGIGFSVGIDATVRLTALRGLQGFLQGPQHGVAQRAGGGPFVGAAHFGVEPLGLPDVVRENRAREHAVAEDVVRDGLVLLAMEASEERRGGGGRHAALAAQALQSLRVEASPYSSAASSIASRWAVRAGAVRDFEGLRQASAGPREVEKVVGHAHVVAEGGSVFEIRIRVKKKSKGLVWEPISAPNAHN